MATQTQPRLSREEYLRAERRAQSKSEFHDGEVFALAGASFPHNLIVANVIARLGGQLRGKPCIAVPTDLRLWIESARRYVYPDVTVVCGKPQFTDTKQDTLINPTLLFEVLSKSTESYDRGEKFELYRTLPSLREYVLLAQGRPYCEQYLRQADDSWVLKIEQRLDATIQFGSIGCQLNLGEVYEKVVFSGPRRV